MNKIIRFILKVPILTRTKCIYKELNALNFDKLFTKYTLLLSVKQKMYLPPCNHINYYNTIFKNK